MTHLEGSLWIENEGHGRKKYIYRRLLPIFENGVRKGYKDVRRALGTTLERAQREAKRLDSECEVLKNGESPQRDAKLGDFVALFISHIRDERGLQGWKTVKINVSAFLQHVGDIPLRRITKTMVEGFLNKRKLVVRATTVNVYLRDLKRLFNAAVDRGYLEQSPVSKVSALKAASLPVRLPTQDEVGKLLAYLETRKPWLFRILVMLISTGTRLGETLALTWESVDFTQGTITFQRRKVQDYLKIPMGGVLKDVLWELWTDGGMPKTGTVFLSHAMKPYTRTRVLNALKPDARKFGMPWLTLRTFRKLAATQAMEATGDIRVAQMLLGHTSVRTTELYLGRGAEARARGVDAMNDFLSGAVRGKVGMKVGISAESSEVSKGKG